MVFHLKIVNMGNIQYLKMDINGFIMILKRMVKKQLLHLNKEQQFYANLILFRKDLDIKKKSCEKIAIINVEINENDEDEYYMCVNLTEKDDIIEIQKTQ